MNWANFDRLVERLRTMPPSEFDYGTGWRGDNCEQPACVACQILIIQTSKKDYGGIDTIQTFLGITEHEAGYVWAPTHDTETVGQVGIADALERLAWVAARYRRPDAAAFLASVRALVGQPLAEVD